VEASWGTSAILRVRPHPFRDRKAPWPVRGAGRPFAPFGKTIARITDRVPHCLARNFHLCGARMLCKHWRLHCRRGILDYRPQGYALQAGFCGQAAAIDQRERFLTRAYCRRATGRVCATRNLGCRILQLPIYMPASLGNPPPFFPGSRILPQREASDLMIGRSLPNSYARLISRKTAQRAAQELARIPRSSLIPKTI
jgi:hypothetical protein